MDQHASTLNTAHSTHQADEDRGLTFTLLWHPELGRIGQMASVQFNNVAVVINRLMPIFDDDKPLASPWVSRSPLQFVPGADGNVTVWPGREDLHYSLDGQRGQGGEKFTPEQLLNGVVVGFGKRGPLVLVEWGCRRGDTQRHGLIGASGALAKVRAEIDRLAKMDCAVLVVGPTGTGKELVSNALHDSSARKNGPFLALNMAALSKGTAQSQLFGHARGSFTGADRASRGYFGSAGGGTLFLDEIGACSTDVQAQLLRALETGEIQPVGGTPRTVDVRVVAATDEDLGHAIRTDRFRSALYHRLAYARVELLPLRRRKADIAAQLVHFLRESLAAQGLEDLLAPRDRPWLSRKTMAECLVAPWPGNTRQLRACAAQMASRFASERTTGSLASVDPALVQTAVPAEPRPEAPPAVPAGADALEAVLRQHGYGIVAAAQALGISRNTLRRRMAEHGIPRPTDISAEQIVAAVDATGSLSQAALRLRISERGLKLRMAALGIQEG